MDSGLQWPEEEQQQQPQLPVVVVLATTALIAQPSYFDPSQRSLHPLLTYHTQLSSHTRLRMPYTPSLTMPR